MMKAIYFDSDWPEEFGETILVTYVRTDEQESDAVLRAMELYGPDKDYYLKEIMR
jgi:hypothetical protein